jgi:hypothetical protein
LSWYTKLLSGQLRDPDLSPVLRPGKRSRAKAKTVTSLFTLLSVLAAVNENSESFMLTGNRGLLRIFESLQMSLLTGFNISMTFHLQARIGASRLKYKLKKELSKWDKT